MSARILIVDDLPTSVKVLAAKLTSEYYDVITAHDGPTALETVEREKPDLVLLDVMMPGMDGFEVCRRIKGSPGTAHIPVVMVTALNDMRDRVNGLQAGADDFLTKPVNDTMLFARVRSLVRMKRTFDQWYLHQQTSRDLGFDANPDLSQVDGSGAVVTVVDASEIQGGNIRDLLSRDDHKVTVLKTYEDASKTIADDLPDVVVISMDFEGDEPLRLASRLRSTEVTRQVPILLIGDAEDEINLIKGLELGVNDCVVRPVDEQEIVARVRTQVRRKRYQELLQANFQQHLSMALTDGLTGLHNRRYLESHIDGIVRRTGDGTKGVSLMLIDLDHFKRVNDTYGHAAGDEVLKIVAKRILRNIRGFDTAARFGGEEFVVAMPDTPLDVAFTVADRIRVKVAEEPVTLPDGSPISVTLSAGVAESDPKGDTTADLIERADKALYIAKHEGRDMVIKAPPPPGAEADGNGAA
ncbi:MAG TPA: PleD family two-component system response regulator [Rhodospirillaceae bacterium]|nr:PleD family two-component system response regulator [Rhodospirillaceae bacterium]